MQHTLKETASDPIHVLIDSCRKAKYGPYADVIEQATAVEALVGALPSAANAARLLGTSQAWVSQRRALLRLAPELQAGLRAGEIGIREARALGKAQASSQALARARTLARAKARAIDEIVQALQGAEPESVVAALKKCFAAEDLIQLRNLIGE
ncbi:hypothetical protein [Rhodococcus sp. ARC_M6]|uniref:hypothetical protein n=1 Tax=Rhodococcus sp. ARC_M6 TaxID=2928852 RepID=UPI001FB43682|nr:hypothetical protein [Rhodococcus sp. ARC_M6]MCJ0907058.1 hypothetical protein [Rhodococcus sp. ARC_M6]